MARTAVGLPARAAATNASPASAGDANVCCALRSSTALFDSTALSALRHEASPVTTTSVMTTHEEIPLFRSVCHIHASSRVCNQRRNPPPRNPPPPNPPPANRPPLKPPACMLPHPRMLVARDDQPSA